MKKIISLVALALILASETAMITVKAYEPTKITNPQTVNEDCKNADCKDCDKKKKHEKHHIKMLLKEENNCLLSEDQKKELKAICDCMEEGKELTEDQKKVIIVLVATVHKSKLGEEDYKKFDALMKKEKDEKCKLTEEERVQLKEYFKKIHSKK